MHLLYSIGTWRVALHAYLSELSALNIRRLIDVRGNPQAGRQEELKRSKAFERALATVGISYEYWGNCLGEDALESGTTEKPLADLLALATNERLCLLGHLHEPGGCHRLHLCSALSAKGALSVVHLLWKDHAHVKQLPHKDVEEQAAGVIRFFNEHKQLAEAARIARASDDKKPSPSEVLPTVTWEQFDKSLFTDGQARRILLPFDTELLWYPHWLSRAQADALEEQVRENVTFYHPTYVFQDPNGGFAKTLIKRGQARICGRVCPGSVGSVPLASWSEDLLHNVEQAADTAFNCFVANHYADGRVVINWHSDSGPGDDEGLGPNPRIGSLSLGVVRTFCLKSKRAIPGGRMVHIDIPLLHGSLLIMGRNSQTHWLHSLPADDTVHKERINLTFRFYARESTKHIEGVEHNHEWETAAESTRVLLYRDELGAGRPVYVDVPNDMTVARLPRHLSTVLPRWRGPVEVCARNEHGTWGLPLASTASAAHAELRLIPKGRGASVGEGRDGSWQRQQNQSMSMKEARQWHQPQPARQTQGQRWQRRREHQHQHKQQQQPQQPQQKQQATQSRWKKVEQPS